MFENIKYTIRTIADDTSNAEFTGFIDTMGGTDDGVTSDKQSLSNQELLI